MKVYWVTGVPDSSGEAAEYFATLAEAHAVAKTAPRDWWDTNTRIDLIEIETDRAAILRMLNGQGGYQRGEALRSWRLGQRGGLVEVKVGE